MYTKTVASAAAIALLVAGCGSGGSTQSSASSASKSAPNPNAKEKSPPGDIPDSTQFVRFKLPSGGFSVRVPEGWARTGSGNRLSFTSNLNSVTVEGGKPAGALTVAAVKSTAIPQLASALKRFKLRSVDLVRRGGQPAVRIRFYALAPANAVTGKAITDEAERYLYVRNGKEAIVTLAGPKGADNVDAWRTMSNSLQWAR
jgi:hypothetical protein